MKLHMFTNHTLYRISMMLFVVIVGSAFAENGEIPITSTSEEAVTLYILGRELIENARAPEAIPHLEKAIALDSNFALAYLQMANAEENETVSLNYLKKAVALSDQVTEGEKLLILGFKAGIDDDLNKQETLYKNLINLYPEDKRAYAVLGNYYFIQQAYQPAVDTYLKAVQLDPEFAPPYNLLGYSYSYLGMYEEAESIMRKYKELIPDEPNPLDSLGEILMKQGKFDESIEAYQKALSLNPNFLWSHIGIGTNYLLKGEYEKSQIEYIKMLNEATNYVDKRDALLWMAASYIDQDKFQEAMETLQKRFKVAEDLNNELGVVEDLELMGNLLLEDGDDEKAREKYIQAFEQMKNFNILKESIQEAEQNFAYHEARLAIATGDLSTAKSKSELYKQKADFLKDPSELLQYHQLLGLIAHKEGDFDTAIQEFEQADQHNPKNIYWLAESYAEKGDIQKARTLLEKVAHFNEIELNYAYVRLKALRKLKEL